MFCQVILPCEGLTALVALKWPFHTVLPDVYLQIFSCGACVIALITLVWLFSGMVRHRMHFQMTSCYSGKLA